MLTLTILKLSKYNIGMSTFVARDKDLFRLESLWNKDEFNFVAVYGRRRVGKTALIREFVKNKPHLYFQATKDKQFNLVNFSASIGKTFFGSADIPPFTSFASALSVFFTHLDKSTGFVLILDEVSYLAESDDTFLSVLQSFVDNEFPSSKLMLILCGSNSTFMEENVLGLKSPVYGRRAFPMKVIPFSLSETALMLPSWTLEEIAQAHTITGGIPYYLSFLKEHENIREAIKEEFFTPGGRLLTEARLLLMMELRAVDMYESILYLIARGNNEVSNISSKSGKDKAVVSQALANLARLGITKRREPFEGVGVARGWNIEDGYFLFFYKYVFPYISSIEFDAGDAAFNSAVSDIDTFTGREMEKVFRRYILTSYIRPVSKIAGIEFPNPKSKQNEEIDLVALIPPDAMLFGECKWKRAKVDISVYNLLQRRAEMAYPKVKNKFYSILSRSGYEDNLIKLADTIDNLLLLTPEDILRKT